MSTASPHAQPPVLVPLDGSERAERALPVAERVAQALRRPLLLMQVNAVNTWAYLPPNVVLPPATYQEVLKEEDRASHEYLLRVADRMAVSGLQVQMRAVRGDPASSIIDAAREQPGVLIVMASHGRTGLGRFVLGSVADRVVTYGLVPTLLVRALNDSATEARLERALVPLDGSETAERALSMVELLGKVLLRQVTLIKVVDPEEHAGVSDEARHYLETARTRLEGRLGSHTCTVTTNVLYGKVDEQIIRHAASESDLIIMGTHGRSGISRWAYGSVASHVLHGTQTPLLLVHTLTNAQFADSFTPPARG